MRNLWTLLFAVIVLPLCGGDAAAQLPVAAGRQYTLSNSAWKLFIPSTYQQRPGDVADLLVHFHGDPQTVWNNALYANLNSIVLTVNYSGLSSAYSGPFSNSALFGSILNEALAKVRSQRDFSSTLAWDQLGVSSFSAGYGAVREILKSATYRNEIDALLAADSLYASTAGDGTPLDSQMVNYKTLASLAQAGSKTFLFSHSQVPTYTYESTMETGDELLQHLGVSASAINESGLGTLDFYRSAQSGNFRLWGALGADGDAHLEHLRYIGEFFAELPLAKLAGPGDFDFDGDVDGRDFLAWQRNPSAGNLTDWQDHYGGVAPLGASSNPVPEPSGMIGWLVVIGWWWVVGGRLLGTAQK
ncbi:hypothetical protein [Bythopirellula polymerisocia]|uniref:Alpha/beta hydrolase family protein n=1 Tax=Bythopirellula polymerisocia TaxID=2528003 RepID=A0A5C6CEB7_9BACT|nr:hypothetical protein [Bythopirellula polymerisocia]TWU22608.1 hypothetical protein Pla144_40680 [Bythopirellula polymerisocia]